MIEKPSLPRRIGTAVTGFLLLALLAVASATPARAVCSGDTCGGGGGPTDYTSTLTIVPSANGEVTITAPGATQTTCSAGQPASCTVTDTRKLLSDIRPSSGWPTYTLHWSGSHVTWDGWAGACSGSGDCIVTNDQESKTATAQTHVEATVVNLSVPSPTYRDSVIQATASGDRGPFTFEWAYCTGWIFPTCSRYDATKDGWSSSPLHIGNLPAGVWTYELDVTDALGTTTTTPFTFVLEELGLSVSQLPPVTNAPAITFSAADPAVGSFRCGVMAGADDNVAWGSCPASGPYAPTLADGTWTVGIEAVGADGVVQTNYQTTTVDHTAPVIAFGDDPAEGATTNSGSARASFTSTDPHPGTTTCTADGVPVTPCTSPVTMDGLGNGDHVVAVTSTDALGNSATATRHFTVALPSTLSAVSARSTYGRSATLSATVAPADATGTVAFVTAGRTLCAAPVSAAVAHCPAPAALAAGTHTVDARYAGPYAPSHAAFVLTVAKAAPRVAPTVAHGTLQRNAMQTVTARGLPTGTVSVLQSGHTLCRATVVQGVARCAFRAAMTPGRHVLGVRYGGNVNYLAATGSVPFTVTR